MDYDFAIVGGGLVGASIAYGLGRLGRMVGLQSAHLLGTIDAEKRERLIAPLHKSIGYHLAIRPFLDALYRPAQTFLTPDDDTMVCRYEEVTAGQIWALAKQGCQGSNQIKAFCRSGMGPCQGRQCGDSVSALIAEVQNTIIAE